MGDLVPLFRDGPPSTVCHLCSAEEGLLVLASGSLVCHPCLIEGGGRLADVGTVDGSPSDEEIERRYRLELSSGESPGLSGVLAQVRAEVLGWVLGIAERTPRK